MKTLYPLPTTATKADTYAIPNDEAQKIARKLIDWFRSPEGDCLGRNGDLDNLSPADCAIRAMRELQKIRRRFR